MTRVISDHKLYWCDGRLNYIASMNVDGSDRRTLISRLSADVHFMSLLLLHDELLVSDWANRYTMKQACTVLIVGVVV